MYQLNDSEISKLKLVKVFKNYIDGLLINLTLERQTSDTTLGKSKSKRASFNVQWDFKNKQYHQDLALAVNFIDYHSQFLPAGHDSELSSEVSQQQFDTELLPQVKAILEALHLVQLARERSQFNRSKATKRSPPGHSFQTSTPAVPPKPQSRFRVPDISIIHPPTSESVPENQPTSSTVAAAAAASAAAPAPQPSAPFKSQLPESSDSSTSNLLALLDIPPQEDSDIEDDSVFTEPDQTANRTVLQTTPDIPVTAAETTGYVSQTHSQSAPNIDASSHIITTSSPPATLSTATFTTSASASRSVTFADPPSTHIPEGRPRDFFVQSRTQRRKRSQSEVCLIDYSQTEDALALLGVPSRPRKRSNSLS